MALAALVGGVAVAPRDYPVGTYDQYELPLNRIEGDLGEFKKNDGRLRRGAAGWYGNVLSEGVARSDPVHLEPIPMKEVANPFREWDMIYRRFPTPTATDLAKYRGEEEKAVRERRLRGPLGMGGKDFRQTMEGEWDQGEKTATLGKPYNRVEGKKPYSPRLAPIEVGKEPGQPIGNSFEAAHVIDNAHRPGLMEYGQSTLKNYLANGEQGTWGRKITPDYPHVHPSVQVMAPRPGDYEKQSGADYLFKPPDIMPPKAPYMYPAHRPGEMMGASVPPERQAEYGHTAPAAYPEPPPLCIPAKDLPFIRANTPERLLTDYCVPVKYLPFFHPTSWRAGDQAAPAAGANPVPGGGGDNGKGALNIGAGGAAPGSDGPYFVAPPTPSPQFQAPMPFSHAPRFPAFDLSAGGGPPPQVPPPPPANYPVTSLLNKAPPLPPPIMPPPMYPF